MHLGAVFPQTEIGSDPEPAVTYARAVEDQGYGTLLAYERVLGANPESVDAVYDNDSVFHEPLTLFAHLAAVTETIDLATCVLILPQRQTALVAKQAAEVDVLSDGRLRLGVAVGSNEFEYEALGVDFETRGRRIEEQLAVLRRLWTEHVVEFEGSWHSLPDVGINPRPVQQPVPIWMGGEAEPVLRRAGRLADGWMPPARWRSLDHPLDGMADRLAVVRESAREAGRDPDELRIVARIQPEGERSDWVERARAWAELGATDVAVDTVGLDTDVTGHVERAAAFAEAMTDAGIASTP